MKMIVNADDVLFEYLKQNVKKIGLAKHLLDAKLILKEIALLIA